MSDLSANVAALANAVRELAETTGRLAPALDCINQRMDDAEGHLGNLAGSIYEQTAEP